MLDLSDGLLPDATRLAEASGLAFHIDLDRLPVPAQVESGLGLLEAASSGEELELLFLSKQEPKKTKQGPGGSSEKASRQIHCIGYAEEFKGRGAPRLRVYQNSHELSFAELPRTYTHW
jgi:thiamine-monophosphate kinase